MPSVIEFANFVEENPSTRAIRVSSAPLRCAHFHAPKCEYKSRMSEGHELRNSNLIGFVTIVDVDRAREFYRDKLGLSLIGEELPFALVFDVNGIMLRLAVAKTHAPAHGTVLGWQVTDIGSAVGELEKAGIEFERYTFFKQDERGIWTAPTGAKVAWFKDPDGNLLSISEHPERK